MRRLLSHVAGLPQESAYHRALRGPRADWSQDTEVQASIVDALQALTFYYLSANSEGTPDRPVPFPRPGQTPPEPDTVSLADFKRLLEE